MLRLIGASALLLYVLSVVPAAGYSDTGFIRVAGYTTLGQNNGGRGFQVSFTDKKCRRFPFSGWNSWEVVEAAYGSASALPEGMDKPEHGKELVKWMMTTGLAAGMNVMRFFGHGWSEKMVFQPEPGVYNEEALRALDYVLFEASQLGVKVVLTFADNWKEYDSRRMYARAAGKDPMEFYSDPQIIEWYKDNIKYIVQRENTLTGIPYKEDPTILAWDLMNEPRCDCDINAGGPYCELECADKVNMWIRVIANYLKKVDPKHMVVVGEEGFYSRSAYKSWVNPDAFLDGGSPWAQSLGQDFVWNHLSPAIDYLGTHLWPDNWGLPARWFQSIWIREHSRDAWHLVKPLVIEEFGKTLYAYDQSAICAIRNPFFEHVYDAFLYDVRTGGPIQGVSFWELDAAGGTGRKPSPYGVRPKHSTWAHVIHPYSWTIDYEKKRMPLASHCVPGEMRSMDAMFYVEFIGDGTGEDVTEDDDVYYTTHGHHLDAKYAGMPLGSKNRQTTVQCMESCEDVEGCVGFRYNPDVLGGTCKFYAEVSEDFKWSADGWQIFYKEKAFRSCVDEGCRFCNHHEICIKCQEGDLHWDDIKNRPSCTLKPITNATYHEDREVGLRHDANTLGFHIPEVVVEDPPNPFNLPNFFH